MLDNCYICIDGRRMGRLRQGKDGRARLFRMPGCSIGVYFEMLGWLMDNEDNIAWDSVKEEGLRTRRGGCTSTRRR